MPYTPEGVGYQDTDTSLEAAEKIAPKAETIRAAVLDCLQKSPLPLSSSQIADLIGYPHVSVWPRLSELRERNLAEDSGQRGKSLYGKKCILWRAKAPAERAA